MSFAVVAMLSVGAFTVNASNKTDQAAKVETAMLAQTPYMGTLHYKVGNLYPEADIDNLGQCTLTVTSIAYFEDVDGQNERIYGWDNSQCKYLPLFEITD